MVMWDEVAAIVAKDFPDVTMEKMLVDAMTCRMVLQPKSLDTIVATNLVSRSMHRYQASAHTIWYSMQTSCQILLPP